MIPKCEYCGGSWMVVQTSGIFEGYWKCLDCGYVGEKATDETISTEQEGKE